MLGIWVVSSLLLWQKILFIYHLAHVNYISNINSQRGDCWVQVYCSFEGYCQTASLCLCQFILFKAMHTIFCLPIAKPLKCIVKFDIFVNQWIWKQHISVDSNCISLREVVQLYICYLFIYFRDTYFPLYNLVGSFVGISYRLNEARRIFPSYDWTDISSNINISFLRTHFYFKGTIFDICSAFWVFGLVTFML